MLRKSAAGAPRRKGTRAYVQQLVKERRFLRHYIDHQVKLPTILEVPEPGDTQELPEEPTRVLWEAHEQPQQVQAEREQSQEEQQNQVDPGQEEARVQTEQLQEPNEHREQVHPDQEQLPEKPGAEKPEQEKLPEQQGQEQPEDEETQQRTAEVDAQQEELQQAGACDALHYQLEDDWRVPRRRRWERSSAELSSVLSVDSSFRIRSRLTRFCWRAVRFLCCGLQVGEEE